MGSEVMEGIFKIISDAFELFYNNSSSGLSATNVQGAIDEVVTMIPSISAANGVSVNSGVIELGGTLTKNTVIDGDSESRDIEFSDFRTIVFSQFDTFQISDDGFELIEVDNGAVNVRGGALSLISNAILKIAPPNISNCDTDAFITAISSDGAIKWSTKQEANRILTKAALELTGSGTQELDSPSRLNLTTVVFDNSNGLFTASAGLITYNGADSMDVMVSYKASSNNPTNQRSTGQFVVAVNGLVQERTRAYSYHRVNADGLDSANSSNCFTITSGTTIELIGDEVSAGDEVDAILTNTVLQIKQL